MNKGADSIVERMKVTSSGPHRRPYLLVLVLLVVAASLMWRSFYLQIIRWADFHVQAEDNRVAILPVLAPRGIIYDVFGQQLVENVASTDILIDPSLLPAEEHEAPLLDRLPQLIDVAPEDVQDVLVQARLKRRVVPIKKALDHEEVLRVEGELYGLPGVQLVTSSVRNYLYGSVLAHILGYSSPASAEEVDNDSTLLHYDITGKSGIEKMYDDALRGVHGASYVEVDAAGRPQKDVGEVASVAGSDLTLSIDLELQEFIFSLIADRVDSEDEDNPATAGAVVALDPRNGAVRALVSYPSFDPNAFSQPRFRAGVNDYLYDQRQPLLNRAISGMYPPGSTIKPFLAVAALEEGVVNETTSVYSDGGLSVGIWNFPDWKAGGHGQTDLVKALAESVNTYFYILAGGDDTRLGLGVKRIADYLRLFGWGEETNIDLPGEQAGLIPSPEWKRQTKDERWYIGDTYHLGIGQGDVLATPLQIAVATVAVANGGVVYQPHVVSEEKMPNGDTYQPEIRKSTLPVEPRHLATVRRGMRSAVLDGSARGMRDIAVPVAGKTGTAQFSSEDSTHAWVTSFGPDRDPELVLTVLLERGGQGDVAAVPVAREVWEWWAENRMN